MCFLGMCKDAKELSSFQSVGLTTIEKNLVHNKKKRAIVLKQQGVQASCTLSCCSTAIGYAGHPLSKWAQFQAATLQGDSQLKSTWR